MILWHGKGYRYTALHIPDKKKGNWRGFVVPRNGMNIKLGFYSNYGDAMQAARKMCRELYESGIGYFFVNKKGQHVWDRPKTRKKKKR